MSRLKKFCLLTLLLVMGLGLLATGAEEDKTLAKKFESPDQIIQFRKFASYNESPELAKLVEEGKLPPVQERLPDEPMVWAKEMMVDGIGEYGGVWRDTFAVPPEGWNWAAGQTQGWFGINQIIQESLITLGPMWMLDQPKVMPRLARSWEWSEDGKTLTMHLVEGVKWSDGEPFTAEDVAFTYRDNILDEAVTSWQSKGAWTFGDKVTELEIVDDYTFKWHFGKSFPIQALYLMDYLDFSVAPAHVYKPMHPKYNDEATYSDFNEATPPQNLPAVVLGPWVPVKYRSGQQMALVRNPYFWQVDEEGNQLPYVDEIWFSEAESGEQRTRNLLAGSGDRTNLENPKMFSTALEEANKEDSHFKVQWEPFYIIYYLRLNQSLYAGVDGERDEALRDLFRKKKFRQAVSHAVNREDLASAAFPGPFVKSLYAGYPEGSPMYQEDKVVKYPYNPEKAKQLLSELGFEDTDGDGIRNWPEDTPMAGKELSMEMMVAQDQAAAVDSGEALVPLLRDVGIRLNLKIQKSTVTDSRVNSGDWEMEFARQDEVATPSFYPGFVGPNSASTPEWHIEGPGGERDLQSFEQEIADLLDEAATMRSAEERAETYGRILELYTENAYTVPVYQVRRGLGVAKRFNNIPADAPTRLYKWFPTGTPIQTFWTPEDRQVGTQYQDLIPLLETYQEQAWYPKD